jgi:hypothetical protein
VNVRRPLPRLLHAVRDGAYLEQLRGLAARGPAEIRLHLGLHKTATTHMQDVLEAMAGRLAGLGIDAPARAALRGAGFPRRLEGGAARMRGRMARLRTGAPVLVISDERWLSGIPGALAPDPYPDPERQLAPVLPLLRAAPRLRLFVGLRDMGTHLPSAWCEALRFFPDTPPFEEVVAARLAAGASWLPALGRLRTLLPEAPLTVWRYEDYRENARAVLAAVYGADPGPLPEMAVPSATRSPRAEDVAAACRVVAEGLPRRDYARRVAALLDGGREGPRFALEDAGIRASLSAAYAADLDALAAMDGVTLLRFGAEP